MIAYAFAGLLNRRLNFWQAPKCVQKYKVVDHAVVADRGHVDAGVLEPARVGFTFVAKRIVLCGDDEGRRQALQLVAAGPKRRHIRIVASLSSGA